MLPKPSATSASAELASLITSRKKQKLVGFSAWPRFGSRVFVEVTDLGGLILEAELLSLEIDYTEARRLGNLRIVDQFEGLSDGLRSMMPKTVKAHLIDLRRKQ